MDRWLVLQHELDVLRSPPLDEAARAELERVVSSAQARRGYWLAPQADLDSVKADLEALGFGDAEAKRIGDLQQELEQAGVDDASDEALDAAVIGSAKAKAEHEAVLAGLRSTVELVAGLERVTAAREEVEAAEGGLKEKKAQAGPAVQRRGIPADADRAARARAQGAARRDG